MNIGDTVEMKFDVLAKDFLSYKSDTHTYKKYDRGIITEIFYGDIPRFNIYSIEFDYGEFKSVGEFHISCFKRI